MLISGLSAVLVAGCSSSPAPTIMVAGTIALGPFCPVEQSGVPCPVPSGAFNGIEAWARNGDAEVRAPVSPDAHFTLNLTAGTWQVSATAGMSCSTITVTRSGPVVIECDTGIR